MVAFPASLDAFPSTLFPAAATLHSHTLATDAHSTLHESLGAAVAALEAKVGIDGSAVPTSIDARVAAVESAVSQLRQGWFIDSAVPVAASSTTWTFVAPTNRTADFYCGLMLKWIDGGGQKYGQVFSCSAAGAAPSITHTVTMIPTTDFPINSGMVPGSLYVSPGGQPQGFPKSFGWNNLGVTATGGGFSNGNGVNSARWRCNGGFLTYEFAINFGSGTAQGSGTYRIDTPVPCRNIGGLLAAGSAHVRAAGSSYLGVVQLPSGANAFVNVQAANNSGTTAGSPAAWNVAQAIGANIPAAYANGDWIMGTCVIPL